MKKILILSKNFGLGGIEKVILTLCQEFIQKKYEVHLILLEDLIEIELPENVKVHIVRKKNENRLFQISQLRPYIYAKRIKKILNGIGSFNLTISNLGSLNTEKILNYVSFDNLYMCVHNTQSKRRFHRHKKNKLRSFFKKKKLQKNYNNKNVITVSDGVKDDVLNVIGTKPKSIRTIYNPFDFEHIRKMSFEENFDIPSEDYIVYVGRLEMKYKRQDILLKAYKKSNTNLKLVIVGDGSDKNKIKRLIDELGLSEKVFLVGNQKNPYNWMRNAKLFVFSSENEGFGNVLVESLIVGTPVVSTNCKSGPSEILIEELANYLVPVNDVDELSKKINDALSSYPEIKEEYLSKFTKETTAKQYLSLIEDI